MIFWSLLCFFLLRVQQNWITYTDIYVKINTLHPNGKRKNLCPSLADVKMYPDHESMFPWRLCLGFPILCIFCQPRRCVPERCVPSSNPGGLRQRWVHNERLGYVIIGTVKAGGRAMQVLRCAELGFQVFASTFLSTACMHFRHIIGKGCFVLESQNPEKWWSQ